MRSRSLRSGSGSSKKIPLLSWSFFNDFFIERFEKYVTSKINNLLNSNTIDTSQLDFAKLSIANIFSFDDYSNSRDLIKNLVGTKEINIDGFEIDKISYSIDIYGDFKSYIREISDINFLKITDIEYSKNIIEIDLIRWVDILFSFLTYYQ